MLIRIAAACHFIVIFIFTCTENLTLFYKERLPHFKWNPTPDLSSFFDFTSYSFASPVYIFQKTGHAFAFFVLAVIVFIAVYRMGITLLFVFSYALFTEVAQLFFHRTGCLLDVGYDMAGVFIFVCFYFMGRLIGKLIGFNQGVMNRKKYS